MLSDFACRSLAARAGQGWSLCSTKGRGQPPVTHDCPRNNLRRLLLYPPELRARDGVTASWTTFTKIVTSGCCAQPIGDSPPRHTSGRECGCSHVPAPHTRGPQPASPAPHG